MTIFYSVLSVAILWIIIYGFDNWKENERIHKANKKRAKVIDIY